MRPPHGVAVQGLRPRRHLLPFGSTWSAGSLMLQRELVAIASGVALVGLVRGGLKLYRRLKAGPATAAVGVVGLGVMGSQLVLNLSEKLQQEVAGFDLSAEKAAALLGLAAEEGGLSVVTHTDLEAFVACLKQPRRIILLVPAGKPVDAAISGLSKLLSKGDVIVDCGNEFYANTERRQKAMAPGVLLMGCGLSGGESGARRGPCLMPGGPREGWVLLRPILEAIAARVGADRDPCVRYMGGGGSGHYVKMVHNGIEYGDMQLIGEASHFCQAVGGLGLAAVGELFAELNAGPLASFLLETSISVMRKIDDEPKAARPGAPLVSAVLDVCGSKGTGKWTVQQAAELGVPCATMAAALEARYLSSVRDVRQRAAQSALGKEASKGPGRKVLPRSAWESDLADALFCSKLCSYAQGMAQLAAASEAFGWSLRLADLATIWRGGCIIRAAILSHVRAAFENDPSLPHLFLDGDIAALLASREAGWRRSVAICVQYAIPAPALCASLAYYDALVSATLPAAQCVQAQRDCFGGHGFKRLDLPGSFHAKWA